MALVKQKANQNPALVIRDIARAAGFEIDEPSFAAAAAYCEELVPRLTAADRKHDIIRCGRCECCQAWLLYLRIVQEKKVGGA